MKQLTAFGGPDGTPLSRARRGERHGLKKTKSCKGFTKKKRGEKLSTKSTPTRAPKGGRLLRKEGR